MVCGLESVYAVEQVLIAANQVREEFRKNFPFPLFFWINNEILQKLIRLAPDLHSWTTSVEFAIASDHLIDFIEQTADDVFAKVLEAGAGIFVDNTALDLGVGSPRRTELEFARVELEKSCICLNPDLEASLEFVLGRDTGSSLEQSWQHYERSLVLLQQALENNSQSKTENPKLLERKACLLYCMGLWWRTYAVLYRCEHDEACARAKDYFQDCILVFEQAGRPNLVANFINALGEVLQRLKLWDELEAIANKALTLHQTDNNQFRLARAYGFLAEVAISKLAWVDAKQKAQQALAILDSAASAAGDNISSDIATNLDWQRSYHRGWYSLSLAKAQLALGDRAECLTTLETAKAETKAHYDPELYILILSELRNGYFLHKEYLTAFRVKQEQRSLEQQYGFRAFVGAGRLQPKQQVSNPSLPLLEQQGTVAEEIAATGRQQDINRFIQRLGQPNHKLTIIHGQSGVGKSSILQAGLIPELKHRVIGTRDVVPVLQQVYTDWVGELLACLTEAMSEFNPQLTNLTEDREKSILEILRSNADKELLTVLIFDQFEEFFFVCKDPAQRIVFYKFLRECLDTAHVRIILSLREDYLYYLLECNERLVNFEVINNNILDKDILYYLGNFSQSDTKLLIKNLTKTTQLVLEEPLIDELVTDLAGELGEVRPIELQVVGTQLQTEQISTLEKYRERGLKEELVGKFLEEVVKDCGLENEQIAKLVLYLLTDENNTRPLKTRADLELELEVQDEKLDLVLEILVKSGLVLRVPAIPANRYQLVHDYLVPFVRQQQSARFIAELPLSFSPDGKIIATGSNDNFVQLWDIDGKKTTLKKPIDNVTSIALSSDGKTIASASDKTIELWRSKDGTPIKTLPGGHTKRIKKVYFSPDDKIIASIGDDNQVKLWSSESFVSKTLTGHNQSVNNIHFSPDSQMIVTQGDDDNLVKLWKRDGTLIENLSPHNGAVKGVIFSPNSEVIACLIGESEGVKLWRRDGTLRGTIDYPGINQIFFSPQSDIIVSIDDDKTLKLWNLDGKLLKKFKQHRASVNDVSFSPDGETIASASDDGRVILWRRNGSVIKNIRKHTTGVKKVKISPDGKFIVSISNDSMVNLWNQNGEFLKTFQKSDNEVANSDKDYILTFSNDSKSIIFVSNIFIDSVSRHLLKIWSIDGKEQTIFSGSSLYLKDFSYSSDGNKVVIAVVDNAFKIWDVNNGKLLNKFNTNLVWDKNNSFSADAKISFSPNGNVIATIGENHTIRLWNKNYTGSFNTEPYRILKGHSKVINNVTFSPDGNIIASASDDKTVRLWNRDGTLFNILGYEDKVNSVTFSPDSKIIASAGEDKTVKLRTTKGKTLHSLQHRYPVQSLGFSPDSSIIISISRDNTMKIWSTSNGNELKSIEGNSNLPSSFDFVSNTQILALTSLNSFLQFYNPNDLWSKESGIEGSDRYYDLSVSPDAKAIAAAGNEGVYVFSLDLDELLVRGCNWARDYLKNSSENKSDRNLCDDILKSK